MKKGRGGRTRSLWGGGDSLPPVRAHRNWGRGKRGFRGRGKKKK